MDWVHQMSRVSLAIQKRSLGVCRTSFVFLSDTEATSNRMLPAYTKQACGLAVADFALSLLLLLKFVHISTIVRR